MGEHVTKLISLHSFHTKNISSKFHRNLMNQIQDMLENVHVGPDYPTAPPTFAFFADWAENGIFPEKFFFVSFEPL